MIRFSPSFQVVLAVLCAVFSFTSCDYLQAEITWLGAATTISTAGASDAQAVMNNNDQVTAIWIDGTDIKFTNWTQSGGWSAEAIAVAAGGAVTSPRLVMNTSGQTMVTWIEGGTTLKYITRSTFSGSWSASASVSSNTLLGSFNELVMNTNGQVIAGWQEQSGTNVKCLTATFVFGSTWSSPVSARGYPSIGTIALAINDSGNVLLNVVDAGPTSWGGSSIVTFNDSFSTVRSTGFDVSKELTITGTLNLNTTIPTPLAQNASSLGISSWVRTDNSTIFATTYNSTSWTQSSSTVKSAGNTVTSLQTKLNDSNLSVAAWTENDGTTYYVKVATSAAFPPSNWSTKTMRSTTNALTDVRLTLDNRGEGVVIWNENVGGTSVVKGSSIHFTINDAPVIETISDSSKSSTIEALDENTSQEFVTVWRNDDDTLMVARAGQLLISPPKNPRGAQRTNKFFTQKEYYNHIAWDASPSPSVNSYKIVVNGALIAQPSLTSFDHRAQKKERPITYTITAVNNLGEESTRSISITVP